MTISDYNFIQDMLFHIETAKQVTVSKKYISNFYKVSSNEELYKIFKRLLSYHFYLPSKTNKDEKEKYAIFYKIVTNSNNFVTFYLGENGQKIIKSLKNP